MGQNVTIISNQSRSSYQRLHLGQNALLKTTEMYSQFVPRTLLQNNRQRWVTNSSRCIFSPLLRKINVLNMRYENFLLECAAGPGAIKILLIKKCICLASVGGPTYTPIYLLPMSYYNFWKGVRSSYETCSTTLSWDFGYKSGSRSKFFLDRTWKTSQIKKSYFMLKISP